MPRKRKNPSRLYTRQRGGVTRYYADLRSLIAPGEEQPALQERLA